VVSQRGFVAKALNIRRGAGFQPAGVPSGPGIRAAIGFDAGRDAGVAGQRPAPRLALEPESSRVEREISPGKAGGFMV